MVTAGLAMVAAAPAAASAATLQPAASVFCASVRDCQGLPQHVDAGNYYLDYDITNDTKTPAEATARLAVGFSICLTVAPIEIPARGHASGTIGCELPAGDAQLSATSNQASDISLDWRHQ